MNVSYDIKTVVIKPGETQPVQASGKVVKVLRVSPEPNQITIQTDHGAKLNMVIGQSLTVDFDTLRLSHTNAVQTVTVILYIGDVALSDIATTQPGSTLLTVDWITLNVTGAVQLLGSLMVQGTNYRRKNLELTNMSAGVIAIINSPWAAKTAMTFFGGGGIWNGQERILPAATATQNFPVLIETDDSVNVSTFQFTGPVDLSIVQTWLPIIS